MTWQCGAKGEDVKIYLEPFATKLTRHFQLALRVKKSEGSL